jgi:hypothetical protein
MSPRKSDDILNRWLAVADSAPRPAHAPRGIHMETRTHSGLPAGMAAALLAAAILVVVVGARFAVPGTGVGASGESPEASTSVAAVTPTTEPSLSVSFEPTPDVSVAPTDSGPSPTPGASTVLPNSFDTPGTAANWKGFAWSSVPNLEGLTEIHWTHGWVLYGPSGVWVWDNAFNWVKATGVSAPKIMVAEGPMGLVAIGFDPLHSSAGQTVWTSADGSQWTKAGTITALNGLLGIAGNGSTLVALWREPGQAGAASDQAFQTLAVSSSNDGVTWRIAKTISATRMAGSEPTVQSAAGRLFLLGVLPAPNMDSRGGTSTWTDRGGTRVRSNSTEPLYTKLYWSDDGRSWQSADVGGISTGIEAGDKGLLLIGQLNSAPGGMVLSHSTDRGKTWQDDPSFGPLDAAPCDQQCANNPDGVFGSNGTYIVAVKNDGSAAWVSEDGKTWTSMTWKGPKLGDTGTIVVLPYGVFAGGQYGAAQANPIR